MKTILLILTLFISGCGRIFPTEIEMAEILCEPFGGVKQINIALQSTHVRCNNNIGIELNDIPEERWQFFIDLNKGE